jgi:hypothetical protein
MELILVDIPLSFEEGQGFDIIYDVTELLAKLFPLISTCRFATWDAKDRLIEYQDGYEDFWDFMDTFAFNFGFLYDSVVTAIESVQERNYFMGGYSIGRTIFLLFF